MKTPLQTLFFSLLLLTAFTLRASTAQLWTSLSSGGANGYGVLYSINPDGSNGEVAINFDGTNGADPSGNLVQTPDGKLYGTTRSGGLYNMGVLFCFNPANDKYTVVHYFDSITGWAPRDLMLAANGKLYGITQAGGTYNSTLSPHGCGVFFSFNIEDSLFRKIVDFDNINGQNPQGIMQATSGGIFGMTREGGDYGVGTIFGYDTQADTFRKLHSFEQADGDLPTNCKLTEAANGNLYGVTTWGGLYNMGVLFSCQVTGNYTKLYDFNGIDGAYPSGGLTQAIDGKLYGVTQYGGTNGEGVIYSYDILNNRYACVHNFNSASGSIPLSELTLGSDSLLYGVATEGGDNGAGVIYNFNTYTNNYIVVSNCDTINAGGKPSGNIVETNTLTDLPNIKQAKLQLYPNPVNSMLYLIADKTISNIVSIYNSAGQQVYSSTTYNESGMNVSALQKGIYTIETNIGHIPARTTFVKQ